MEYPKPRSHLRGKIEGTMTRFVDMSILVAPQLIRLRYLISSKVLVAQELPGRLTCQNIESTMGRSSRHISKELTPAYKSFSRAKALLRSLRVL